MAREAAITEEHLRGVLPLLDQLQLGFVLIGARGEVVVTSYRVRTFLGRRPTTASLRALLGGAWDVLVDEVLAGTTTGNRWREVSSSDGELHASVRSIVVELTGGGAGALLSLVDVSHEIGLHARYKATLARLEEANEGLRRRIASVLREHEDDLAQFEELLQVAPAIFASFVGEAQGSVEQVAQLVGTGELHRDDLDRALRATHTVKGNARGLGLHFIAGRAHAVEDLLLAARDPRSHADPVEFEAAVGDLRRAVERAAGLRGRLTPAGAGRGLDTARIVERAAARLEALRDALADAPGAGTALDETLAVLDPLLRLPLDEVFAYLRVTAQVAAEAAGKPAPDVETSGGEITVTPAIHAALSRALPHLIRNAVVHGLEPGDIRTAAGKAAAGRLTVEASAEAAHLVVRLRDDGRGLDRERLRAGAVELGLTIEPITEAGVDPVDQLIFHPGLSTAATVSMDAGRGFGTNAAREAIDDIGGRMIVRSTPGVGVEIEIVVPVVRALDRARPAPG